MWVDDQFSCTSVQNSLSVYDYIYLNDKITNKIIQRIQETNDGLSIWKLYNIFDDLFIKNHDVWNNSINVEKNLQSIDHLIEQVNQYINNNQTIDKVIWYSLNKFVMRLKYIKEKLT